MFCSHCGARLLSDAAYCKKCGAAVIQDEAVPDQVSLSQNESDQLVSNSKKRSRDTGSMKKRWQEIEEQDKKDKANLTKNTAKGCAWLLLPIIVLLLSIGLYQNYRDRNQSLSASEFGKEIRTDKWSVRVSSFDIRSAINWKGESLTANGQWLIVYGEVRNISTATDNIRKGDFTLNQTGTVGASSINGDATGGAGLDAGVSQTVAGFSGVKLSPGRSWPLVLAFGIKDSTESAKLRLTGADDWIHLNLVEVAVASLPSTIIDPTSTLQPTLTREPTNTLEPTNTPIQPTNTLEPTNIPEPTDLPDPTITPEPTVIQLTATMASTGNVRDLPNTEYSKVIGQLNVGVGVELRMRQSDNSWFLIDGPGDLDGWVSGSLLTVDPTIAQQVEIDPTVYAPPTPVIVQVPPTTAPSVNLQPYLDKIAGPLAEYEQGVNLLNAQVQQLSQNTNLLLDPTWRYEFAIALATLNRAAEKLATISPVPPEARRVDNLLKQIANETPDMVDDYAFGVDDTNVLSIRLGIARQQKINGWLRQLATELENLKP